MKFVAKVTSIVNEKNVNNSNHGLSSKEILFSRDQFSGSNLTLVDKDFVTETIQIE